MERDEFQRQVDHILKKHNDNLEFKSSILEAMRDAVLSVMPNADVSVGNLTISIGPKYSMGFERGWFRGLRYFVINNYGYPGPDKYKYKTIQDAVIGVTRMILRDIESNERGYWSYVGMVRDTKT